MREFVEVVLTHAGDQTPARMPRSRAGRVRAFAAHRLVVHAKREKH
jgi:hypothetical protein